MPSFPGPVTRFDSTFGIVNAESARSKRLLFCAAAAALIATSASQSARAGTIDVGPNESSYSGSVVSYSYATGTSTFTYTYNSFAGQDPNITLNSNAEYDSTQESGAKYYVPTTNSPSNVATLSYTFTADTGYVFSSASIEQFSGIYVDNGSSGSTIIGTVSVNGGSANQFFELGPNGPATGYPQLSSYSFTTIPVSNASTFTITYSITNNNDSYNYYVQAFRDDTNNDYPIEVTGTLTPTPEPAGFAACAIGSMVILRRRRRRAEGSGLADQR